MVVREARLNRAYDASVHLPERADPDDGKKKRARAPEVEVAGPIAAPPLRSVRPRDDAGTSRSLDPFEERSSEKLAQDPRIRLPRSGSSSKDSSEGAYSRTTDTEAVEAGRTISQVKKAVGKINLTGLATSECSSEASPSDGDDVHVEGSGDAPAIPRVSDGNLIIIFFYAASLFRRGRRR